MSITLCGTDLIHHPKKNHLSSFFLSFLSRVSFSRVPDNIFFKHRATSYCSASGSRRLRSFHFDTADTISDFQNSSFLSSSLISHLSQPRFPEIYTETIVKASIPDNDTPHLDISSPLRTMRCIHNEQRRSELSEAQIQRRSRTNSWGWTYAERFFTQPYGCESRGWFRCWCCGGWSRLSSFFFHCIRLFASLFNHLPHSALDCVRWHSPLTRSKLNHKYWVHSLISTSALHKQQHPS